MSENMFNADFFTGFFVFFAIAAALRFFFWQLTVQVEDETVVMATQFGKLSRTFNDPGLHFFPARLNPAVKLHEISLRRDFRLYRDIHINDLNGTTVIVDLWVEFRINAPKIAHFEVENWEETLESGVAHAAMTVLSGMEFKEILSGGHALSSRILAQISEQSMRWGIKIERAYIRDVGLIPEVSAQLFDSVAAKLERAKAIIEERGRLAIAELDARTASDIAELKGQAKAMYPRQLSPVFAQMARAPRIVAAYRRLHTLSRAQPHKTVYFDGFAADEIRPIDAAMLWPQLGAGSHPEHSS